MTPTLAVTHPSDYSHVNSSDIHYRKVKCFDFIRFLTVVNEVHLVLRDVLAQHSCGVNRSGLRAWHAIIYCFFVRLAILHGAEF